MGKLINKLESIKIHHGMYIGEESVIMLQTFIEGYIEGLLDSGLSRNELEEDFELIDCFRCWLALELNCKESIGWGELSEKLIGNSKEMIQEFYILFDRFINSIDKSEYAVLKEKYKKFLFS